MNTFSSVPESKIVEVTHIASQENEAKQIELLQYEDRVPEKFALAHKVIDRISEFFRDMRNEVKSTQQDRISDLKRIYEERINEQKDRTKEITEFSLRLLQLNAEQKDKEIEKTLRILEEISSNSAHDSLLFEDDIQKMNDIDELLSEDDDKLRKYLESLDDELGELRSRFDKENARYQQILDLKNKLNVEEYNYHRIKLLISCLEIASEINTHEIAIIEKKRNKISLQEKRLRVKHIREDIERKKDRELSETRTRLKVINEVVQKSLPYQNE